VTYLESFLGFIAKQRMILGWHKTSKSQPNQLNVLHLPTDVGGNPMGLSNALKSLGVNSVSLVSTSGPYGYVSDVSLSSLDDSRLKRLIKRLSGLTYLIGNWDVIHFNFGSSLATSPESQRSRSRLARFALAMQNFFLEIIQIFELFILRLRRIPHFVHYQGDDARQGGVLSSRNSFSILSLDPTYYDFASDKRKRRLIKRMTKYAAGVYALNPDLLRVLPQNSKFLPYSSISPIELKKAYFQLAEFDITHKSSRFRIAHAPSNRLVKGTEYLIAAVENLKSEGLDIELMLIEGKHREDALLEYGKCDVLVDQLVIGWYGGLAVEAMFLGKPVMAYINEEDLSLVPVELSEDLPIITTTVSSIEDDLRKMSLLSRSSLEQLGRRSRSFAEEWHSPNIVAKKVQLDYLNYINQ
jgi:glycosyltransferase involved in cell wall biosynthesis